MTNYKAKDFSSLLGMKGFSEKLLQDHFGLYEGYVSHTNELLERLSTLSREGRLDSVEHAELRRRLRWEFDGMRLHELYFGNLGGTGGGLPKGDLQDSLATAFGDEESWLAEFKATGSLRGVGWAILYHDPLDSRFLNLWVGEHDAGHPAGCIPLLVMDVWEHAFATDYGTDRASYIDAFLANIDWRTVERRLQAAREMETIVS
jgi:superoxide dismutase, Fe-Mn family